jgi:hypothetical protein
MARYEYIEGYEALPKQARARLLAAVHELGAECAREAYQEGLDVAYQETGRGDWDALRELLQRYGVHEVPYGYTGPEERHPIWGAFWAGVESVAMPKRGAILDGADLAGADLQRAEIGGADLGSAYNVDKAKL